MINLSKLKNYLLFISLFIFSLRGSSEPLTVYSVSPDGFPYPSGYCSVSEGLSEAHRGNALHDLEIEIFAFCAFHAGEQMSYIFQIETISETSMEFPGKLVLVFGDELIENSLADHAAIQKSKHGELKRIYTLEISSDSKVYSLLSNNELDNLYIETTLKDKLKFRIDPEEICFISTL